MCPIRRDTWDNQRWLTDRLVEAVEAGGALAKAKYAERLLTGWENEDWPIPRIVEEGLFLKTADLNPNSSSFDSSDLLEDDVAESRLQEIDDGAEMTPPEIAEWRDRIVENSFNWETAPCIWVVLELTHSARRSAYMAVTDWLGSSGSFVAACLTYTDAIQALTLVGFVGPKDYQARSREVLEARTSVRKTRARKRHP